MCVRENAFFWVERFVSTFFPEGESESCVMEVQTQELVSFQGDSYIGLMMRTNMLITIIIHMLFNFKVRPTKNMKIYNQVDIEFILDY